MSQKLPQICTVILRIRIMEVAWSAVYICGNFRVTQYLKKSELQGFEHVLLRRAERGGDGRLHLLEQVPEDHTQQSIRYLVSQFVLYVQEVVTHFIW